MFKLFKTKIPKDNAQEVILIESWTIEWFSKDYNGFASDQKHNARVFSNENDMIEFKKQLEECSKFINAGIAIKVKKN